MPADCDGAGARRGSEPEYGDELWRRHRGQLSSHHRFGRLSASSENFTVNNLYRKEDSFLYIPKKESLGID